MQYSSLVKRIAGETVDAWDIHYRAVAAQARGEDVIVLSIGDSDFATPPQVVASAIDALHAEDTHYADVTGRQALREAIAQRHQARSGQPVTDAHVIVMAGTQNGLFASALCLVEQGDEVIVLQPMYVTYEACIQLTGATLVPVAMPAEKGFRLDREALRNAITPRTKAIFFASPCNPTGVVLSREELAYIAELAQEFDLWIVADEVYQDVTFDVEHQSMAQFAEVAERVVTLCSLSKSHAMTGWRIGWVVAPPPLIAHLENLALCMLYGLPGFIQQAALTALHEADSDVARMREAFRRRRDLVAAELADVPNLSLLLPQASMFAMLDVRATGLTAAEFAEGLFAEVGVSVLDAQTFGACAAGHVRMCFASDEATLREACARIRRFSSGLQLPG